MTRRWPALLAVPVLLLLGLVVDTSRGDGPSRAGDQAEAEQSADLTRLMPVASSSDALASTWYCAAGTAADGGEANQTVVVYNPNDRPTSGTLTAIGSDGRSKAVPQEVPPRGQIRVAVTELVQAPYASVVAEFRGGGVVVEHIVKGPDGVDVGPCATAASDEWHFAAGASTIDAHEVLVFFNPFPEAATLDVAFSVEGGSRRLPRALQGLQVPARSVVAAPVSVAPTGQVSATVVARAGRVVAERILRYDGQGAGGVADELKKGEFRPKGLAVTLGVPRTASTWVFPSGVKDAGLHERYVVYNPSAEEAEVEVSVGLFEPKKNGEVDPFRLTVNPRSWAVLDLDGEGRIPKVIPHGAVVTSANRVPFVVERVVYSTDPLERSDLAITPGSPLVANRWVLAAGGQDPGKLIETVAVTNPNGGGPVTVRLRAIVDGQVRSLPAGTGTILLPAHQSTRIRLPDDLKAERITIEVTGARPIVAERILTVPKGTRTSTAIGVPAGDATIALAPSTAGG